MPSTKAGRPHPGEYLLCDMFGKPCTVLFNLELAHILAKRRRKLMGILLGHIEVSASHRTLVTIEDCHSIRDPDQFAEELEYWRTEQPGQLTAVGLVCSTTAGSTSFFGKHFAGHPGALLVVEPTRWSSPLGRLTCTGAGVLDKEPIWSEIPLDSSSARASGLRILQGSPGAGRTVDRKSSAWGTLTKWAWVPLPAALLGIVAFTFLHAVRSPPREQFVPASAPAAQPEPMQTSPLTPAPTPPVPHKRQNREQRPAPPVVTVELHAAPDSLAKRLTKPFRSQDARDLIPPVARLRIRPTVPASTARAFPGEWRVNLRVTVDKSGRVARTTLLNPDANREFVHLAKDALARWRFEPGRDRKRPVTSALDVTFRFHNPSAP